MTDTTWIPVTPLKNRRGNRIPFPHVRITLLERGVGYIMLNAALRHALNATEYIRVYVSHDARMVRIVPASAKDFQTYTLIKGGQATCTDLLRKLGMRPGESISAEAVVSNGEAVVTLPD